MWRPRGLRNRFCLPPTSSSCPAEIAAGRRVIDFRTALDLRGPAVDKQLNAGDVTRIVGREEGHGRGDFVFRPGSTKRRRGRCLRFAALNLLLAEARGLVARWDDGARRHHVDAYAAVLQLHSPTAREGT